MRANSYIANSLKYRKVLSKQFNILQVTLQTVYTHASDTSNSQTVYNLTIDQANSLYEQVTHEIVYDLTSDLAISLISYTLQMTQHSIF